MDDFMDVFDSLDEYPELESDTQKDTQTQAKADTQAEPVQKPVPTDTISNDDVFDAFDRAMSQKQDEIKEHPAPAHEQYEPVQIPPVQPHAQRSYAQQQPDVPPYAMHIPPAYPPYHAPMQQPNYMYPQPMYAPPTYHAPYYYPQQSDVQAPPQPARRPVQPYPAQPPRAYAAPAAQPPKPDMNLNPYSTRPVPQAQKEKTPKKTKGLIIILIILLVVFMVGFFASCTALVFGNSDPSDNSDNPLAQYGTQPATEYYDDYDPNRGGMFSSPYDGESFDVDITLQADEGQTQQSTTGAVSNTYEPDEDVKDIELHNLPKDQENKKYTTQYAYNAVTDSVVSVICYAEKITDNPEDIIGEGTGTVISSDGYIVTNSHVIGDTSEYPINIVFNNSDEYPAKVVGFDSRTDLAVLKIDAKNLTYSRFGDSSLVEVGQDIVAIGNPGGSSFQNSLTKGIVSAVDRKLELNKNVTYIQLDAAINPGNSGGPLCNTYGQVIGINTAKIASEEYEGMGFAIPSNTVADIANDLIHYGYVKDRVRLGLMGREVDNEMVYLYSVPYGILITEISKGGPLSDTEIEPYDILTAINGVSVETFQEVYAELAKYKPGDTVTLTLYRLEY